MLWELNLNGKQILHGYTLVDQYVWERFNDLPS